MSTDYFVACYTCKTRMQGCLASGSGFYGYKVWADGLEQFRDWMVGVSRSPGCSAEGFGAHEGHDVRIVSEHVLDDLEWGDTISFDVPTKTPA